MEDLVKEGVVKSIGLSNFNSKQVQRILDNCTIKPAVIQVKFNAVSTRPKYRDETSCESEW